VDVTVWKCFTNEKEVRVPIGRPISNTQIYILDCYLHPLPIGVVGEIYIGGIGVGRGYLNRPDLTAERFIPDPFSTQVHARLYKTGDLGKWRADGAIEYLGRNDFQVKVRGFRIELGEIEHCLVSHPLVKEAVAVACEDTGGGGTRLVAYVTASTEKRPSVEELRAHMKTRLPEYMVPSAVMLLEQFSLSPNGKLDRRALPNPTGDAYIQRAYESPLGEIEELLAGVWLALLRVPRVGRRDNFFELGGHSLLI
jgi:acyl-CoA synthetase (AMP-forming)/AMP-acid ligase II